MRHNNRKTLDEFPIPDILVAPKTLQAFEKIAMSGNKDLIKDKIYKGERTIRGEKVFEVRSRLTEIYFNKCAYCEDIEAKPEVEHYRPKKGVSEDSDHPGYYWLCYEWSNLLPACHSCNTETGKRTQFPIAGNRVSAPSIENGIWNNLTIAASNSPLIDEVPLLLHPEIDNPDDMSFFDFENSGKMIGSDTEGRGQLTIDICDLNRQTLLKRRQELLDEIVRAFQIVLEAKLDQELQSEKFQDVLNIIFKSFQKRTKPEKQFSLFAEYLYLNFDDLIVPLLQTSAQSKAVSEAFKIFNGTA